MVVLSIVFSKNYTSQYGKKPELHGIMKVIVEVILMGLEGYPNLLLDRLRSCRITFYALIGLIATRHLSPRPMRDVLFDQPRLPEIQ